MFEWSKEGLQLLNEINIRIESYGGREFLLQQIEKENPVVTFNNNRWTSIEVKFLLRNVYDINGVSEYTKRSKDAIRKKIYSIRQNLRLKKSLFS